MDKKNSIRKLKPFAPVLSAGLVIACAGASLHGYEAPAYASYTSGDEEVQEEVTNAVTGSFDLEDGIYQGTGTGYAGNIVVAVQIKDQKIVSIDILESSDDAAFLNRAKAVIDRIIESQNLDVDTVSGATYSSKGIISAVKNALTGEKDQSKLGISKESGAVAGSQTSVEKIEDAKAYKDGTYYGTGTGFGGTLKVKVVINGGKIASIQIVEHQDGSSYIRKASSLIEQMIAAQSTNVDTVSGATYSSVGIIQAVRNALSKAAINTGASAFASDQSDQKSEDSNSAFVTGTIPYNDGIYYGTAEGYRGDITVAVVIQDHTIKAILVMEQEDDEAFFDRAMDVVKNVVKKQSTDVDTVSGATYSSKGLLDAVKKALKEAERVTNGEETSDAAVDYTTLEDVIAKAESLSEEDYTEVSWARLQVRLSDAREALKEKEQKTVDCAAENLKMALNTLEKKDGTKEEEENTIYLNGTYTGTVLCEPDEDQDFEKYQLSLKITIREDKIVSVTEVKGDGDPSNDSYIKRAANGTSSKPGVVTQIVEKGTLENIDTVSGATCSSKSILEACEKALESAKRP